MSDKRKRQEAKRNARRAAAPQRSPRVRRVEDQIFNSLRAALDAVHVQATATGAPARFAAFINEGDPERVIMQFAPRSYWLEGAPSAKFRELLEANEDDARVFVLNPRAGSGSSRLLAAARADQEGRD